MGMEEMDENSVAYWRRLANNYKESLETCQEEADEFRASSQELEAELEKQLEQQEKRISDLSALSQKQQSELEMWRDKYYGLQSDTQESIKNFESEMKKVKAERDEAQTYIRELEQVNDDLERAKRALIDSLSSFEEKMNQTLEKNAILESELGEKDDLMMTVHRLKEETKDLKSELQVRERSRHSSVTSDTPTPHATPSTRLDANQNKLGRSITLDRDGLTTPFAKSDQISAPRSLAIDSAGVPVQAVHPFNASPITPSARISALNIVGDLLRKVGALESKLASCKRYPSSEMNGLESPNSPKTKIPQLNNSPAKSKLSST